MAKNDDDAPPTLGKPKTAVQKNADGKAKLAQLKAKAAANRPAAKLTYGVTLNGKFEFVKQGFDSALDAMNAATKTYNKYYGKGLREIIVSIHK